MSKIIANPDSFNQYIPEKMLFRTNEISQISNSLKNSINTFVYGPCGSGKSSLIKQAIGNSNTRSKAIYIDCSLYQTTNSILREILSEKGLKSPIRSRSNYELIERLEEIKKKNHSIIICLDHFQDAKEPEIVGKLIGIGLNVVIVSDTEESIVTLDSRTRASIASIIAIPSYSVEQTFEILKQYADQALAPESHTDSIIRKVAELCNGNIALGINAIKTAAFKAESENRKAIEERDIPELDCPKFSRDEKVLLEILREWKSLPSSRLFDFYVQKSRHPKGERSFRNYMESLCAKGLVKAVGKKRGRIYEIGEEDSAGKA
jgi:Cdc6-like AAA superfamily ATPase